MAIPEPLAVTRLVGEVLDGLEVPWVIGGSLASSFHGMPRSTQDVDLVADLTPDCVGPLVEGLKDAFYIDADAVADAVRRRSSFNAIHLATMTKVDVFVLSDSVLTRSQLARRRYERVDDESDETFPMSSPEDIVLVKLSWYRRGGEVSQRQWGDVLGVLRVVGGDLDLPHMRRVAASAGLDDLLERALTETST